MTFVSINNKFKPPALLLLACSIVVTLSLLASSRSREIDPYFDPSWYWSMLGQTYMVLHSFEEALAAFEHFPTANYWVAARMAGCYAALSDTDRAASLAATCMALKPDFKVSHRMSKEPNKNPADIANLTQCLSNAGLPM